MGLQDNKLVVRRFYEEARGGNLDVLDKLVGPEFLLHGRDPDRHCTLDDARQIMKGQRSAFPDWKVTVNELIAENDLVASNLTITGTHRGRFRKVEPTGRFVEFNGVFIDRVRDGKIVEMWHSPDYLTLLIQIGAIPEDIMAGQAMVDLGDANAAQAHFEGALAFCRKAGYRPELARSLCDYAGMLLERVGEGDSEKAMAMLDESLAISTELGMRPLMERVLSRRERLKAQKCHISNCVQIGRA